MLRRLISVSFLLLLFLSGCGTGDKTDTQATIGPDGSSETFSISVTAANGTIRGLATPCTGTCNYSYPAGTLLTLTAVAAEDYEFDRWSGACSGGGNCQVTVDRAKTLAANFTAIHLPPATYSVQVSWSPPAEREDHSQLPVKEIDHYEIVYTRLDDDFTITAVVDDPEATSLIIEDLLEGDYQFYAMTVDTNELHSRFSEIVSIAIGN